MTPAIENIVDASSITTSQPEKAPEVPSIPAIFTEGELLPWKGRWFRVHLNEDTKRIELEMLRPTAQSVKLAERRLKWSRRHSDAKQARAGKLQYLGLVASQPQQRLA